MKRRGVLCVCFSDLQNTRQTSGTIVENNIAIKQKYFDIFVICSCVFGRSVSAVSTR